MKKWIKAYTASAAMIALIGISLPLNASRTGKLESSLIIPYFNDATFKFSGGAMAELNSDPGLGFGFGYNYTDQIAARLDITMNSISYTATRVLDDSGQTTESYGGSLDSFSMRFGGDYYFMRGNFSPFVNANIGYNYVDSGVVSGTPGTICWWDPWWGYICDYYVPTYSESSMTYGLGGGVRFDFARSSFVRLGYFVDYIDFDQSKGTENFDAFRFEFGFSY